MIIVRKTRHKLAYKNRRIGLTCIEKMSIKSLALYIDSLSSISTLTGTFKLNMLIKALCMVYMNIIICEDLSPRRRVLKHPFYTFDRVDPETCYIYYTVLKQDLPRLHRALGLDALGGSIRLENGMEFGTEEALLILLYKFAFPTRNIQLVPIFGRDHTSIGRVFNWMNKYIREQHGHLVTNNLGYWKSSLESFSEAIRMKVNEKSGGQIHYPEGQYLVAGFIDDTVLRISRPGGGPAEEGVNAERYNNLIQQAFFNGYKACHGIKFQTVEGPNGMCLELYGPKSFR